MLRGCLGAKERSRDTAKHLRFTPWVTLAQAEAYATEKRLQNILSSLVVN
jgi:hypothetical protein